MKKVGMETLYPLAWDGAGSIVFTHHTFPGAVLACSLNQMQSGHRHQLLIFSEGGLKLENI